MTKFNIDSSEFTDYFGRYLNLVDANENMMEALDSSKRDLVDFFESKVSGTKLNYRYQPGKWTVKEVLQHIIDTERIFMYRSLRAGRLDPTPMQGFDQDVFDQAVDLDHVEIEDMLDDFVSTRNCYISLLKNMSAKNLSFTSTASGGPISARAAAMITIGHQRWHRAIIEQRYL